MYTLLSIVYKRLKEYYGGFDREGFIATRIHGKSLYEFIVGVLLSQNTSDRNAIRAYENLSKVLGGITPEKILGTRIDVIEEAIRVAGLYRARARNIVELAKIFLDKQFIEKLYSLVNKGDIVGARKLLTSLPGIGYKTADVVLLMYFGKPVFPVDTHIARITVRLGFVDKRDYESIRLFWEKNLSPRNYLEAHLLLITHGRRVCKARKPLCSVCVLRDLCRSYKELGY